MGCSPSTSTNPIIISSKRLTLDVIKVTPKKILRPFPTRFIENVLVIWLDDETTSELYSTEKTFLSSMIYQFRTFDQYEQCLTFLRDIFDERIFLIHSNRIRSIDDFLSICHFEKFYRFDSSTSGENENENETIFPDIDRLWKQLQDDIQICRFDLLSVVTTTKIQREIFLSSTFNVKEATFLFGQAVREIIYRLKFESCSKEVFIEFCRTHYKQHDVQIEQIEEFATNYRPNKALNWLINPTFISRILQRAQRTYEIDILYKLGFFIKQVNLQLTHLAEENRSSIENFSSVYRGKTMTKVEFDKCFENPETSLVSFNSFLICSMKKDVSIDFLHQRLKTHPDRIGILFQIDFDLNSCDGKCPFAYLKETEQICFDLNTIFHLISIDEFVQSSSTIYTVKLKIARDDDSELSSFRSLLRVDELHANPLPFLAKLLMEMGEYRRAEQCFLAFLQDPSVLSQPRRLARVQNGLGGTFFHRGDFVKALEYFQQTLETTLIYLPVNHIDLISIYKSIGDCHWNNSNYVLATENYEKALEIAEKNGSTNQNGIVTDISMRLNQSRETMTEKGE